jgi:ankyrin repeat protein
VKLLLEKGANLESKSSNSWTPLLYSVGKGYKVVLKLLLEKGVELESKSSYS